jgi:hypothetical protein
MNHHYNLIYDIYLTTVELDDSEDNRVVAKHVIEVGQ